MAGPKVDNKHLVAKLDLRRHFLRKYHAGGDGRVFDCCQGDGVLWRTLRQEFALANYWGVDVKKKTGRLQIDSARILAQPGWREDIIDVDVYGSPWGHWEGIAANIDHPATVFLTIGETWFGADQRILVALGCETLRVPPGIRVKLNKRALGYLLTQAFQGRNFRPIEAVEAVTTSRTRYLGVRLDVFGQNSPEMG
jgi:hypothetical protein